MWCKKCDNDISECTCDDLYDRIRTGAGIEPNVFKRCRKCGRNYLVCDCKDAEYEMVGPTGTWPSREKVEVKVISSIDLGNYLEAMSDAIGSEIGADARKDLQNLMEEIFMSQRDEHEYIDLIRMAYMLSSGLSFVLKEMAGDGDGGQFVAECSEMVH